MKLIQVQKPGPPGVMQLLDVPVPEPKPGEVLIRAHAIGVGMPDCLIRAGTYSWMPPLPATPGTELAGTIEKVGSGVTSRHVGQRVYTTARERPHRGGHYADYVATPAEATFLLPDGVAFDAAAALANYQVAYHIFNDALKPRHGQTVLIYAAAGGMGNALIDLAKIFGLIVIGVVSNDAMARFARDLGADHVIDRKSQKVGDAVNEITPDPAVDPSSIRSGPKAFPAISRSWRRAARWWSMADSAARRRSICRPHCGRARIRRQSGNFPSTPGTIWSKSAAPACAR